MGRAETAGAEATGEAAACLLCGRLLTDEASRARGFGPRCAERLRERLQPRPRKPRKITHSAISPDQLTFDQAAGHPVPCSEWTYGRHPLDRPIHTVPTGGFL